MTTYASQMKQNKDNPFQAVYRSDFGTSRNCGATMQLVLQICIGIVAFFVALSVRAEEAALSTQQNPWEKVCRHQLPKDTPFLEHEKVAWADYLCVGKKLDMQVFDKNELVGCDPTHVKSWPKTRILSSKFLRTILFFEPYKNVLPRPLIRIECAQVLDEIDWSNYTL